MFLFNSGQVCAAGSRVYIQRDMVTSFVESLKVRYAQVASTLGANTKEMSTFMGPVADEAQFNRVMEFIESGKQEAKLVTGGHRVGNEGYFIAPTIFTDPKPDARILREEIFGPVLTVLTFDTEEEALHLANDSEYGLAGEY
jgi:aldehyde dehydrogenase (NAD+)